MSQGFLFDTDTMEPQIGDGFRYATSVWKDLWNNDGGACDGGSMESGRCAIGYGPPGCWKGLFLNGMNRKDANGTVVWEPTMKSGEYAEPYRFKPFGSVNVVDRKTGELTPCTPELCPKSEIIPTHGHHGENDRASVLPASPLQGKLINRAPFYWSGGLGTLIRKSSEPIKKDLMWDFFVYTNSPQTSVEDVANYASWLDSWRYSQLLPGDNFLKGGWSQAAYEEHAAIQQWMFSNDVNGALNLRIPGISSYTRDVVGEEMFKFVNDEQSLDSLVDNVIHGWNEINQKEGTLNQLATYRGALGLDAHSEVELCKLHRDLMDVKDPTTCRKYDPSEASDAITTVIFVAAAIVILSLAAFIEVDRRRVLHYRKQAKKGERDEVLEVETLTQADSLRVNISRLILIGLILASGCFMSLWASRLLKGLESNDNGGFTNSPDMFLRVLISLFVTMLVAFVCYDCFVRSRNRKVSTSGTCL